MSWAKMGKSAIAPPKERLPYQVISSTVLLLKTNFIPSVKLCITGSPIFGFIIGFLSICDKSQRKNRTDKNGTLTNVRQSK
jgi:hypothetical protein